MRSPVSDIHPTRVCTCPCDMPISERQSPGARQGDGGLPARARPFNPSLLHLCSLSVPPSSLPSLARSAIAAIACFAAAAVADLIPPPPPPPPPPSIHCLVSCHHPSGGSAASSARTSFSPFLSTLQNTHHLGVCASYRAVPWLPPSPEGVLEGILAWGTKFPGLVFAARRPCYTL